MSQRLYVGETDEVIFDCILTSADGAHEKLARDWLRFGSGFYLGPWKIWIDDIDLWRAVEPAIENVIVYAGGKYPDDVWMFYRGVRKIEYPTKDELEAWLRDAPQEE